jgi:hypothetical protein
VNNTKKIALAAAMLCSAGTTLAQEVINPSWYVPPTVVGIKPDHDFGVGEKDWGGGLKFGKPCTLCGTSRSAPPRRASPTTVSPTTARPWSASTPC